MRHLKLAGLALAALLAGCLMVYFYLGTAREPQYQGRSLSDWIKQAENSLTASDDPEHPERNPRWMECRIAVQHMGTNALPFLIDDLLVEKSKIKPWLSARARGPVFSSVTPKKWRNELQQLVNADQQRVLKQHLLALNGFALLARDARPVEPVLIKLAKDKNREKRFWGFCALTCTKPPKEVFMPAAALLLKDSDEGIRENAAATLQSLYPDEAEKAGVYAMFPDLKPSQTNQVIQMP